MGLPAFDTHAFVKRLKLVGFSDEQAEAQAELQSEILSDLMSEKLARKDDIKHLEASIRQEIATLSAETKQDIAALAAQTKHDIATLSAETKQEFIRQDEKSNKLDVKSNGRFHQLYWMLSFLLAANMTILYKIFHL